MSVASWPRASLLVCLALFGARQAAAVQVATLKAEETPVAKVVTIIASLREEVIADGKVEQMSYDKFACWCEETLGRKANAISSEKEQIEALGKLIIKLKAEIATHGAEIKQLEKDIAANVESVREATEVRNKDNSEYEGEKSESEQCMGALEAAIKVLNGAGTKKSFLEAVQEAQLLSIVGGIRSVLERPRAAAAVSDKDMDLIRRFVTNPDDFMGRRGGFLNAVQIANNPFGDYAPQSTQIQGILKGLYDAFAADLEKDNAEEADAQKAFEELLATKLKERDTLQATLDQHTLDEAQKSQQLAESQEVLDATVAQLDADEKLFDETKTACKIKAGEWAERTRLRTEELTGINKCIAILSSPDSQRIFEDAHNSFLQVGSAVEKAPAAKAYGVLKKLAVKFKSNSLAQMAANLREGGHFDKVISAIDAMIEVLRKEEQDDIQHRDRCQNAEGKNKNDLEDLDHAIERNTKALQRLQNDAQTLQGEVDALRDDILKTQQDRKERLSLRNTEEANFQKALKDDTDAIALLDQAIVAMTEFYRRNKIPLALAQHKADPKYTVDPDKAPTTTWTGSKYQGRTGETVGLVAILEMVKEDLEKEVAEGREENAQDQAQYLKEEGAMKETQEKQEGLKLTKEKALAEVESLAADTEQAKSAHEADKAAESELKSALYSDCSWVDTHFDDRRTKRKAEIDGLVEAKGYLAGVEASTQV